jgi:hypothetical protein
LTTNASTRWQVTSAGNLEKQTLGNYILSERKVVASAASPVAVTTANARTAHTNEGAAAEVNHNLPTASAGLEYVFYVQAAQNLRVTAAAGDTLRLGATVSAVAGNAVANTVGHALHLVAINATEWVATAIVGAAWTVT